MGFSGASRAGAGGLGSAVGTTRPSLVGFGSICPHPAGWLDKAPSPLALVSLSVHPRAGLRAVVTAGGQVRGTLLPDLSVQALYSFFHTGRCGILVLPQISLSRIVRKAEEEEVKAAILAHNHCPSAAWP